jgi:hypothetical protein
MMVNSALFTFGIPLIKPASNIQNQQHGEIKNIIFPIFLFSFFTFHCLS